MTIGARGACGQARGGSPATRLALLAIGHAGGVLVHARAACSAGLLGELVRVSIRLAVHVVQRRRVQIAARAVVVTGAPAFPINRPARVARHTVDRAAARGEVIYCAQVARHMMHLGDKLSWRAQPAGGGCGGGIGGVRGAALALQVPRSCLDGAVSARWALVA